MLFVCIGNSCRSQMAEAFARRHAADVMEPASCGIRPCDIVAPATRECMLEKGIDLRGCEPKSFAETGFDYDLVVNMSGFELPGAGNVPQRAWDIEDPYWAERRRHREIRDEIEARVLALAEELRARRAGRNGSCGSFDTAPAVKENKV